MILSHSLNLSSSKIVDVIIENLPLKKEEQIFSFSVPKILEDDLEVGKRVFVPFGKGNKLKRGIIFKIYEGQKEGLKNILGFVSNYKIIDSDGIKILSNLSEKYFIPISLILKKFVPLGKSKRGFEYVVLKRGFENLVKEREKKKIDLVNFIAENGGEIKLDILKKFFSKNLINSLEKRGVIEKFYKFEKDKKRVFKEERDRVEKVVKDNNEIQILDRLIVYGQNYLNRWVYYKEILKNLTDSQKRVKIIFPEKIYVEDFYNFLDDNLKKISFKITGETGKSFREDIFQKIEENNAKIVIGTFFSLLLPINEDLIIVDMEERFKGLEDFFNFDLYKISDEYCKLGNKKLIIGSFFPSISLNLRIKRERLELKRSNFKYKRIELVPNFYNQLFTSKIKDVIKKNKNKKIFIFYPRKGYFSYLICDECGYVERCPKCKIPLTYFKEENKLICKICGYKKNLFDICPNCHGISMNLKSPGTERVKEKLSKIFKDRKIYQLDESITKRSKKIRENIEKEFLLYGDIVVGTNLILPLLRKVNDFIFIFLNIDFLFNLPEYDAFEEIFYLILKVVEEASLKNGKIFIQTKFPKSNLFTSLVNKNLFNFINDELRKRKESKFPPFYKYILIENFEKNYLEKLESLKNEDDEFYLENKRLRMKTKNLENYKSLFDKIKYSSKILIKEF